MKIVHVITGLNNGGAEGVLYRLCMNDPKNKHVVISMMGEGKYGPMLQAAGFEVHCLNMRQGRISFYALWRIYKLLRKFDPNIVQTWMYHADFIGGMVARLAGVRYIFWNVRHTNLVRGKSKLSTIWLSRLCGLLSGTIPHKIVYCAHAAQKVHEALGYKKGKAEVISNGYDLARFSIDDNAGRVFRSEIGVSVDENLIGMVGRFDVQKDHANLVTSLCIVKNAGYKFKLLLAGRNLNFNNKLLIDLLCDYQLTEDVVLLDQCTKIPEVMNGLDLHVLSSSFGEAFPNVVAEAMACGVPCVSTDVGDSALIMGGTGWVVQPKDPQSLACAIMEALEEKQINQQAWLHRQEACRKRIVENFSIENMVENYRRVWNLAHIRA